MKSSETPAAEFSGRVRQGKTVTDESYAPFIELDCRFCRELVAAKAIDPVVVIDIGARGGFDPRLQIFGEQIKYVGFEPDPAEAGRLKESIQLAGREQHEFIYQAALWEKDATLPLYIQRSKESTSVFKPNMAFFGRLPDPKANENIGQTSVDATTLDACDLPTGKRVDLLKLDVEGAELSILRGAENLLKDDVLGVIPEITFVERYIGQPFFADVDQYLRRLGFSLFDLKVRRWRRKPLTSEFNNLRMGQLVYGDALYLKDPIANPNFCRTELRRDKLVKLAAFAEFFSMPDFAIELLEWGCQQSIIGKTEADGWCSTLLENKVIARHDFNGF